MKPGRRSKAEIEASSAFNVLSPTFSRSTSRLTAPASLTDDERSLFQEQAALWPHLSEGDAPMLATYCQAITLARAAAREPNVDAFDKVARLQATLATKLRLTPQARTDPKMLARRMADRAPLSAYERMRLDEEG
jgi:hypothetical protein